MSNLCAVVPAGIVYGQKKSISECVWEEGEEAGASVCFQKSDKDDEIKGLEVIL